MILKVLRKFPPTLVLVHGWLFPVGKEGRTQKRKTNPRKEESKEIQKCKEGPTLGGFKKALLQNPREMIRGQIFKEMIRVSAQSQSYRPKVGVTDQKSELQPGRTPESEPNRPEKWPEWRSGASTENLP